MILSIRFEVKEKLGYGSIRMKINKIIIRWLEI
jgi:hypothetical protein